MSSLSPLGDNKLPVIDPADQAVLFFVDDKQAREYIKSGKAVYLRTKHRIRGLQLVDRGAAANPASVKPTSIRQRGTMGDSHNHDREDNPEGCWTIDRVGPSKRRLFFQVLIDCMPGADPEDTTEKRAA